VTERHARQDPGWTSWTSDRTCMEAFPSTSPAPNCPWASRSPTGTEYLCPHSVLRRQHTVFSLTPDNSKYNIASPCAFL